MDPLMVLENENQQDKQEEKIVPPAIYDPGAFDLSWLLDKDESVEDI